jgi:hypothetical protein
LLTKEWDTWEDTLDEVGTAFKSFRSLSPDRLNVKQVINGRTNKLSPVNRASFGLPIIYVYRQGGYGGTLVGEKADRRASPLLFHISQLANGKYIVGFTHFRAPLLPNGSGLKLQPRRGKAVTTRIPGDKPIFDFIIAIGSKSSDLFIALPLEIAYPSPEEEVAQ